MTADKREARAYIFLNGEFEKPEFDWPAAPGGDDLVIAADGGLAWVLGLGWSADYLIGDLDSADASVVNDLAGQGLQVISHPTDKDEIDFELALKLARKKGYMNIEVLAALGGRWDMSFGNLLLPRATGWGSENIRFRQGRWTFWTVNGPAEMLIKGERGELLSLLPLGEDARGVSLAGCRYPLFSETLRAGLSRGLSNELAGGDCRLEFASGSLLVCHRAGGEEPRS